ncbi:hypothetical protein [Streptococcus suis]|uniref:hypothetical protein n=1 Tax=Streptococcus suis TaxID=1307 RepID=UPI000CF71DD4|nr:hypothetical protein [Streptococcus suis]
MNKRIKKKYRPIQALEQWLLAISTTIDIIVNGQNRLYNRVAELENIIERNAQATNSRFDKIEQQVANTNAKKSWFGRK